jgi:hypothetical protein
MVLGPFENLTNLVLDPLAMAALRATAWANVVAAGGGDEEGCRDGRGDKGGNGCGEGNGAGDDGGDCGGIGDGDGCSSFGVNGGIYGVGKAELKSTKTTTTT